MKAHKGDFTRQRPTPTDRIKTSLPTTYKILTNEKTHYRLQGKQQKRIVD